jgi:hypothetical protein
LVVSLEPVVARESGGTDAPALEGEVCIYRWKLNIMRFSLGGKRSSDDIRSSGCSWLVLLQLWSGCLTAVVWYSLLWASFSLMAKKKKKKKKK